MINSLGKKGWPPIIFLALLQYTACEPHSAPPIPVPAPAPVTGPTQGKPPIANNPRIQARIAEEKLLLEEIEKGLNFALTKYYREPYPEKRSALRSEVDRVNAHASARRLLRIVGETGPGEHDRVYIHPRDGYYGVNGGYNAYHTWVLQSHIARIGHGTAHAARTVLWTQLLALIREGADQQMTEANRIGAGLAAAFHDSGRQDDGVDLWDSDSATHLKDYLATNPHPHLQADTLYRAILYKDEAEQAGNTIEQNLLNAADTLEIMRFSGSRLGEGFDLNHFKLSPNVPFDFRMKLLSEIQGFIDYTEDLNNKRQLELSHAPYRDLLHTVDQNKARFPLLHEFLAGPIGAL